jgi:hypothetical protein
MREVGIEHGHLPMLISPEDLGTHFIRKGITTWLISGSTVCPPITPVHLRLVCEMDNKGKGKQRALKQTKLC